MTKGQEVLEGLKNGGLISGNATCITTTYFNNALNIIEKELKALELLIPEISFIKVLKTCKTYEEYLAYCDFKERLGNPVKRKYTQEEFELLKEMLE